MMRDPLLSGPRLSSSEQIQLQMLEWLAAKGPGSHNGPAVFEGCSSNDQTWRLLRDLAERGLVYCYRQGSGRFLLRLEHAGNVLLDETDGARNDASRRRLAARQAVFDWVARGNEASGSGVVIADLRRDHEFNYFGEQLTELEIDRAAANLAAEKLIDGPTIGELDGPVRARLTHRGLTCLDSGAGDVSSFIAPQHPPHLSQSVAISGNNFGPIQQGGAASHLEAHTSVSIQVLCSEVDDLVSFLRQLGLTESVDGLEDLCDEAQRELRHPTPNVVPARRLVERAKALSTQLSSVVASSTLGALVAQILPHLEHSIATAL
jgi:hypothetical protein